MAAQSFGLLNDGRICHSLPLSECNERMPFLVIQCHLLPFSCSVFRFPFVLLLRSLVEGWLGKFSVLRFPFSAWLILMAFNGIRAAPLMTFNGSAVLWAA